MSITQTLTPFDSTKQPIEGTIEFRANATYAWSWLIEHTNQQIALINQINSTVSDMNSLAQTVTTKAQEVSTNTGIVNQAKIDAQAARDAALNAKSAVETIYDTFDDRYLGSKTTAPTLDNDGNALQSGALYFNSTSGKLFIYDLVGAKWVDITIIPTLLSSLSDVALVNKVNNDVLQYDSASGKWVNRSFYSKAELDAFIDIHSKTAKTTPVDADEMMIADSTTTFSLKKITWSSIKTTIKTYLDTYFIPKVLTPTTNALAKIQADGTIKNSSVIEDNSGNVGVGLNAIDKLGIKGNIAIVSTVGTTYTDGNGVLFFRGVDNTQMGYIGFGGTTTPIEFVNNKNTGFAFYNGDILQKTPYGLGYGTGAGGTVTQLTSKSTSVTLNKPTGTITMNNAALAAGASVGFYLNNNLIIGNQDLLSITTGGSSNYDISYSCSTGIAFILVKNKSAGSLSEAIIINFALIKGAIA